MNNSTETIKTTFNFPPPLRTACQQYLLGFKAFLDLVELKAGFELMEEGEKTIFVIKPEEPSQAEKLKTALAVYLKIPELSSKEIDEIILDLKESDQTR